MKGYWANKLETRQTRVIATLRAQNGKMVSSSKGKREVLVEHLIHHNKLRTTTAKETLNFENEINAWAERGERRCNRKGRQWFGRVTERVRNGRS